MESFHKTLNHLVGLTSLMFLTLSHLCDIRKFSVYAKLPHMFMLQFFFSSIVVICVVLLSATLFDAHDPFCFVG
jgi:hypothetical protein